MDILSASQSVAGGPHHHHHYHHHRIISNDANLEASENKSINGWQSTKMNINDDHSPRKALRDRRTTPTSIFEKGKAKESEDLRTPRRTAASKALKQVMRNSEPPVSDSEMTDLPSSSKSPSISPAKGESALSSPFRSTSTLLNSGSNGMSESKRKQLSPSPFPTSTRKSGPISTLSSPVTQKKQLSHDSTVNDEIDLAEMNQFRFKADSPNQTAILPRQAPNLPYDPTYLPLSPNGVDQVGHTIHLPAQNQIGASGKAAEAAKLGRGSGPQNKKVLPGQEMENHIVSEMPGQRAIPWGLQATLLEKQQGGPRAKTKSGVVKRRAVRELRPGGINKIKEGADSAEILPLKLEDDVMSDLDSPKLPIIHISEMAPEQIAAEEEEEETDKINKVSDSQMVSLEEDIVPLDAIKSNEEESQKAIASATPNKIRRHRESTDNTGLHESPMRNLAEEIPSSQETSSGNTRRPREAHKRLKVAGGYYRKPGRYREDAIDKSESNAATTATTENKADATQSDQTIARMSSAADKSSSRATSFAPEDTMATVEETDSKMQNASIAPLTEAKMTDRIAEPVIRAVMGSNATTNLRRMTAAPPSHGSPSKLKHASGEDANEEGNNEYCETCRGVGHFICCDGCPRSFHFACINPPLDVDELPSSVGDKNDTWYCNVCKVTKSHKTKGKDNSRGVLSPLLKQIEGENPSIFSLPSDIRNYFKGVATANDGSYVNSSMLRPIKVNKFGVIDEREPLRLKDKNGKSILCYQCGESAMPAMSNANNGMTESPLKRERPLREAAKVAIAAVTSNINTIDTEAKGTSNWRRIISCDFCNLHWHLDCLDPPLATMPSLGRKWMCPNHIEHVMPSERIPKSVANSTTSHELPMPSRETIGPGKHYRMRVINDGQIDIIPDPLDIYTGPAHDGPEDGFTMLNSGGTSSNGNSTNKQYGSGEKGWQEINLPAYKAYPTVFGNSNNIKLKYRIPEKVIRLDFWSKMELHREQVAESILKRQSDRDREGLDMLALIASALEISSNSQDSQDAPQITRSIPKAEAEKLTEFVFAKRKGRDYPFIASGQEPVSTLRQSYIEGEFEREFEEVPSVQVPLATTTSTSSVQLDRDDDEQYHSDQRNDELIQMRALRRIIAHKGKDALLRFLLE